MSYNELIEEWEENNKQILLNRNIIADLSEKKYTQRSRAWTDATGTAKEKEDYVKSYVSHFDKDIKYAEAKIEYLYNRNTIIMNMIGFEDE